MLPSFKADFEVAIKWEKERECQEAINDKIEPYYNIEIERAINENDTNFLTKAKEIIEQKGEILQGELLELLEKSKTDTHAIKKLESEKGLYFNILEKSRATGGKALKHYVPLKENKTIINGIEINAEQTLFSE